MKTLCGRIHSGVFLFPYFNSTSYPCRTCGRIYSGRVVSVVRAVEFIRAWIHPFSCRSCGRIYSGVDSSLFVSYVRPNSFGRGFIHMLTVLPFRLNKFSRTISDFRGVRAAEFIRGVGFIHILTDFTFHLNKFSPTISDIRVVRAVEFIWAWIHAHID